MLGYIIQGIALNAYPRENGIVVPKYSPNDKKVIMEQLQKLQDEYKKYRFESV